MSGMMDLKQIERKAFRSTYQDGLLDIFMGYVVCALAIFVHRPEEGYSALNIVWLVLVMAIGQIFYQMGKKYISVPRMGQARFGPARQQKKKSMAIIMGIVVLIQAGMVGLTSLGWINPAFGKQLFGEVSFERLTVSAIASLFVGAPMLFIFFMTDFGRGYYIAILMAAAVFLMIYTNQVIYPLIAGGLILVPGLVLFIRFIRSHPIPHGEESHGRVSEQ